MSIWLCPICKELKGPERCGIHPDESVRIEYDSQPTKTRVVCMCGEVFDSFEVHGEHVNRDCKWRLTEQELKDCDLEEGENK